MRNVCRTVDDFLENLRIELVQCHLNGSSRGSFEDKLCPVHRRSLYLTRYESPVGENKRDANAVRFNVIVHVGAVVATVEGEYLLECAEEMGIDYHDASQEREGSEQADLAVAKIEAFCQAYGLMVRPGAISY